METSPLKCTSQFTASLQPDRIMTVAREFESLFSSMMLKAMRKTIGENGLIPSSMGEKIYTEMLDDNYAQMMATSGSLGLAEIIEKELRRQGETPTGTDLGTLRLWVYEHGVLPGSSSCQQTSIDFEQISRRLKKWDTLITETSNKYAVDRDLVTAVVAQESAGNQYAVSRAGAKGLMQLMNTTAHEMGVTDTFDPAQNIDGGVKYLSQLLNTYNGNEQLALAAYNAGPGSVDKYNGIPPYRETRDYISSVLKLRERFQRLSVAASVKE